MTHPPAFWTRDAWPARLLSPLSHIGAAMTARRVNKPGWRAPVPVICCGNATVGGAGKTTVVLDLARRLSAGGAAVHILLRGYRAGAWGTDRAGARGTHRVTPDDTAERSGDEALLLARVAPTWIGADRAASARAAVEAGADMLLMDDGLQNPTLEKTFSLLVIDGATGFGNGRVLPAGSLREPVASAVSRCRAAVLIGPDISGAASRLPPGFPVLRATLVQGEEVGALKGQRVFAFAGIAFPDKFFLGLERAGVIISGREAFPDHHLFREADLRRIEARAKALNAVLVTTPKDAVRLPPSIRAHTVVVDVRLVWENEAALASLLHTP